MLAAASGCSCLTEQDRQNLDAAGRNFDLGNFSEALQLYTQVAHTLETRKCDEAALARLREASCLHRLGRFEESERGFEKVPLEKLDPSQRRELLIVQGQNLLELGQLAEAVFLPNTPESRAEINRRKQLAGEFYEKARSKFFLVVEPSPEDFDGQLGKGIAQLRLGVAQNNSSYLKRATETLQLCQSKRPNDKRVLFYLGLAQLYDVGEGMLSRSSGDFLIEALKRDSEGNYDFHSAYRDVLFHLEPYRTPEQLEAALEKSPEGVSIAERLIALLEGYDLRGREPPGDWGQALKKQLKSYLSEFQGWKRKKGDYRRNIEMAREKIRGEQDFVVNVYQKALKLLDDVAETFRSDPAYVDARSLVQKGYVDVLLDFGKTLVELGELDLAKKYASDVRKYADDKRYIPNSAELTLQGNVLDSRVEAYKLCDAEVRRLRDLIVKGSLDEARSQWDAWKGTAGERRVFLEPRIKSFDNEIQSGAEVAQIFGLLREGRNLLESNSSDRAIDKFGEAYALAESKSLPELKEVSQRLRADAYFRLRDFGRCREALAEIASPKLDDTVQQARCFSAVGDYDSACRWLKKISDSSVLASDRDKVMAGVAFLRTADFDRAREFLESAPPGDSDVVSGLRDCYWRLYESKSSAGRGDREELEDLLVRLVKVDPGHDLARRNLAFVLFQKGDDGTVPSDDRKTAYWTSYQHLTKLRREGKLDRLTQDELRVFSQLLGAFGEFMPLAVGNTWRYEVVRGGSRGGKRIVTVRTVKSDGLFGVGIETDNGQREETWQKAQALLKRFDPENNTCEEFPIQLLAPSSPTRLDYIVLGTNFVAETFAGETCKAGNQVFNHCLRIRVTNQADKSFRDYYFAPGIGEVKMETSDRAFFYELTGHDVREGTAAERVSA
jgi:hypothetical protein